MSNATPQPVSIAEAFSSVKFLPDRTPMTTAVDHFATLANYRDGAIFIAHYAGNSEWERHPAGDEIVLVIDGSTTLIMLVERSEVAHQLRSDEFRVVPQNTWHRFETPDVVKVLTVTPQPTDHQVERP